MWRMYRTPIFGQWVGQERQHSLWRNHLIHIKEIAVLVGYPHPKKLDTEVEQLVAIDWMRDRGLIEEHDGELGKWPTTQKTK